MLDNIKGIISDAMTENKSAASGKWVNGKFIPNDQLQQEKQSVEQMQQPMMQQPMGQMQQPMMQQPMDQMQQPMMQQPMDQTQQPAQQQPQSVLQSLLQKTQQPNTSPNGKWVKGKWVSNEPEQVAPTPSPVQQQSALMCPKCKSHNVNVQLVEVGSTTKTKQSSVGLGGHAHNAARAGAAIMTLGASNLVIKKATGTEKSKGKVKTKPFCVCQDCGNTWKA